MKLAFTGKGGSGKTTLASLFIKSLASEGGEVLACDCDVDSNLAGVLGFEEADEIIPIVEMKDVINERMGVADDRTFFKLNPKVDDIPEEFSLRKGNIVLIVMGVVKGAEDGCMCPENRFMKNLISHIVLQRNEHVVMDMEAGIEHLGRGTAKGCDFIVVVVEPSVNSVKTALSIRKYADGLGVKKTFVVGNKIRTEEDIEFIKKRLDGLQIIETIDFDENFLNRDKGHKTRCSDITLQKIENIKKFLKEEIER